MKTTTYFSMIALVILLASTKSELVSAQGNENPLTVDRTFPMFTTEAYLTVARTIPIECDGATVDRLTGTLDVFCRMFGHYDPLHPAVFLTQWMIHNYSGMLTGTSGEVFDVQGVKKINSIDKVYSWHMNLKGSMGSHYILIISGTTIPFTLILEKVVCN